MIPIVFFFIYLRKHHFSLQNKAIALFSIIKTECLHQKKTKIHKVAQSWLSVFVAAIVISWADLKAVQLQMYNYLPAVKAGGMLR